METLRQDWSADLLLWATRGRSWGFRILRHPALTDVDWLSVYEKVFSRTDSSPAFFHAELEMPELGRWNLIAARFADPDHSRDDAKRPIPHELILFAKAGSKFLLSELPTDWHLQVFEVLRREFQQVYAKESIGHLQLKFDARGTLERGANNLHVTCNWKDLGVLRPESKASKKKRERD